MSCSSRSKRKSQFRKLTGALAMLAFVSALADPPAHAPAHGWRKKNDAWYVGYTGRDWERDYGIIEGHCDRDAVGAVLGAVVGGAVGSHVDTSNRTVAIVVGTVIGAVIGREIGERMDDRDRACMGHALELAKDGASVRWSNADGGISYVLTPLQSKQHDSECRRFKLQTTAKGKSTARDARACRDNEGRWRVEAGMAGAHFE